MAPVEARVHPHQVREAAQEEPRAHDEHHGERDLADDQRVARARLRGAGRRARARLLQRVVHAARGQVQEGREAEDEAGEDGDGEREEEHGPVDRDFGRARDGVGVRGDEQAEPRLGQPDAGRRAGEREQRPLGHELGEQAAAARAERGADRELLLPRLRAREQQVGEVGARDEQHEPDGALQDPERGRHVADDVVLERVVAQPVRRGVRHVRVRRDRLPLAQHAVEVVAGLRQRDAILQPADQVERVAAAAAGMGGVDGDRLPQFHALVVHVEPAGHDAHDARRDAVDLHRAADGRRAAVERLPPEIVREQRDGLGAGQRVGAREQPAGERFDAERGQQVVADFCGHRTRRTVGPQVGRAHPVGADAFEGPVHLPEVEELGRRDPELVEAERRELARDEHEPARLGVAERPQHHPVHHAEDGRVGANPERQRQDGDDGKPRALPQTPHRVDDVSHQRGHGVSLFFRR